MKNKFVSILAIAAIACLTSCKKEKPPGWVFVTNTNTGTIYALSTIEKSDGLVRVWEIVNFGVAVVGCNLFRS